LFGTAISPALFATGTWTHAFVAELARPGLYMPRKKWRVKTICMQGLKSLRENYAARGEVPQDGRKSELSK